MPYKIVFFTIIEFQEFQYIKSLLSDEEKLEDYLDYLHIQKIRKQSDKRLTLEEVRKTLTN